MASVELTKVTKVYQGDVTAVSKASLTIRDKEFVVLVGPSGCGKSTLLRMIAGLEEITSGEIKIDGRVVNDVPPKDRDIAMVFQNYALYPHMTVFDNMAFSLKLRKVAKAEIRRQVEEAAQILGLQDYLKRKPKELSGGQRQRVAVGRAIVRHPKVFLFDEPLSNLDAKLRVEMRAELKKLHQRLATTMIYVTHDQVEAMTLGDRIVVLDKGMIQQVEKPLTIYDRPCNKFVAGFVGTPPMNFLPGKLVAEANRVVFVYQGARLNLLGPQAEQMAPHAGKSVELGIRPEDLSFAPGNDDDSIPARIEVAELLGDEMIVHLQSGDRTVIARVDSHEKADPGTPRPLWPNMLRASFYDPGTGARL